VGRNADRFVAFGAVEEDLPGAASVPSAEVLVEGKVAVVTNPWIQAEEAIPRPFRRVTASGGPECDGTVAAIATSGPNRRRYLPEFFGRSDFPGAAGSS